MDVSTLMLGLILLFIVFIIIRWYIEKAEISNLEMKPIFITGCDSGFGRALAIKCAQRGMPVFAGCQFNESINELRLISKSVSDRIDAFTMDVTCDESVARTKKYLELQTLKYGGLHGIINNAGILGHAFYDDFLTIEDYKKVAEVNVWGVIRVTKALKGLVKKTRGRIVIISSICSRLGLPGIGPYTVSKFALSGYCDVLRQELRVFDVSVHVLEPGFFKTHLTNTVNVESQLNELYEACGEDVKEEYGIEFFTGARAVTLELLNVVSSERTEYVTDAYFHALTAVYPRSRYQVGWDSILLFIPLSFLPTAIQDLILMISEKLAHLPLPAALKRK